ncbi:MAG: DUF4411 family protein [Terriglobales bacterium]
MLYLLDANILIAAANTYYGISRVPEFWGWLQHQAASGHVKLPIEMYEEVLEGRQKDDELLDWVKDDKNRPALILDEMLNPELVRRVVAEGYANDLADDEVEKIGRDPFLIAYAFGNAERCIVTTEVSKPRKQRHNRHVPDVCQSLKVSCCGPWELNEKLGFKTGWQAE